MNKKLITALLSLSLIVPLTVHTASAATTAPSVAILDTGIDDTLPAFQGKIITEVCILEWTTCPNGTSFQEAPHAAVVPSNIINLNGFDHGTQMASTFVANNPNTNIVFIKIIGNTPDGSRQLAGEASVYNALAWVKANAAKYNIQAVTMSQGHHNLGAAGTDYCPKTPITEQAIKDLVAMQIPVFFPVGNGADYTRIDWPACIDASISVGATDRTDLIANNSNNDTAKTDFFTTGYVTVASPGNVMKNIAGSSAAIQVAAAKWLTLKSQKPSYTYDQILSSFKNTATAAVGRAGTFNKLINLNAALSYTPVTSGPTAADIAAAQAAAKALLQAQFDAAIAAAQAEYDATVKAAADKLASTKATWTAKLNG
jgi:hypothetical protein